MPPIGDLTILIPVDISEAERPDLDVLDLLRPFEVVLLGYFPVPDQAEPALIRDEYEAEAMARLDDVAAGRANLTDVLVFTHDRGDTVDRIADQYDCDAVLTAGRTDELDRVLVPIRGETNLDRITSVVASILRGCDASATFLHAASADGDRRDAEALLRGTVERMTALGIEADRVRWEIADGEPNAAIVASASAYDLVVLGETEPSLRERIIGDVLSDIVRELEIPALVVRDVG